MTANTKKTHIKTDVPEVSGLHPLMEKQKLLSGKHAPCKVLALNSNQHINQLQSVMALSQ